MTKNNSLYKSNGCLLIVMWFFVSMFYAYQYVVRAMPAVTAGGLIERFSIDADRFTQYTSLYYLFYTLAHIPIGIAFDRYNPKNIISICALLCVAGILPLSISDSLLVAKVGRALSGIGSVAAFLGACKVIQLYFPKESFAKMIGFTTTIGFLGGVYGTGPVSWMFGRLGWDLAIYVLSGAGVLLACCCWITIPSYDIKKKSAKNITSILSDLREVFSNKMLVFISLLAGLMTGTIDGFADVWSVEFLHHVHNIDKQDAAFITSLIYLSMALGLSVIGIITQRFNVHYEAIILCGLSMIASYAILLIARPSYIVICIAYVALGIASAFQLVTLCKAISYASLSKGSLAIAAVNMIVMIYGYFFHRITGIIIQNSWDGKLSESYAPLYDAAAYIKAMYTFPIAAGISVVGFVLIKIFKL